MLSKSFSFIAFHVLFSKICKDTKAFELQQIFTLSFCWLRQWQLIKTLQKKKHCLWIKQLKKETNSDLRGSLVIRTFNSRYIYLLFLFGLRGILISSCNKSRSEFSLFLAKAFSVWLIKLSVQHKALIWLRKLFFSFKFLEVCSKVELFFCVTWQKYLSIRLKLNWNVEQNLRTAHVRLDRQNNAEKASFDSIKFFFQFKLERIKSIKDLLSTCVMSVTWLSAGNNSFIKLWSESIKRKAFSLESRQCTLLESHRFRVMRSKSPVHRINVRTFQCEALYDFN